MGSYSVAQAKAQLSALLEAVERGEEVTITKRGVAVATLSPVLKPGQSIDWARIKAFRQSFSEKYQPKSISWVDTVRESRDS